ncbi:NAD(P)/FAD-dependent oxidoreductase [Salinarimonas sp.]|uniref:NAD(P)/FAD-dependent oxidoreductase n=1 Tax=Salinarimonas sp. TaxID=2766526 RepID=UPI00391C4EA0
MTDARQRRVVVVGAGFGGLEVVRSLERAPVAITLVDRHNHHCFQPLLYQVATAALSPADIAWPIRSILRNQDNVTTLMADVDGIDVVGRVVHAGVRAIPFDDLVLATGATHAYFGNDEWAKAAPGLKTIEDAAAIRRDILIAFERAEYTDDPLERARQLTFVVVGGGPTGVEMAGAIAEVAKKALTRDFRRIDPRKARVVLVEAGPRVLGGFPENLSDYAARALRKMGVEVMTDTPVTGCDEGGVDTKTGRIEARTIVWGAGVRASPAAEWVGGKADRAGRLEVEADLTVPGHPEIFAIGDTAHILQENGKPVPGIAPAAKQMGAYVARVLAARAKGAPPPGPFRYRHEGDLATIGRKAAVVKRGRLELTGFLGWLAWSLAHVYFLIGLRARIVVGMTWLWSYATYRRGARLIANGPPAKPLPPEAAPVAASEEDIEAVRDARADQARPARGRSESAIR